MSICLAGNIVFLMLPYISIHLSIYINLYLTKVVLPVLTLKLLSTETLLKIKLKITSLYLQYMHIYDGKTVKLNKRLNIVYKMSIEILNKFKDVVPILVVCISLLKAYL